ncbi:hypothetical protein [Streptomyces coffeae]|uniref:Uncharacterized protein n=1 Tax=Streptomyces coffeae TaxID=621382 RepID=A0ABS1N5M5_9ACTN|nr:hypothetical protein [Streptomyces coffeae]MBL1095343.1 hypothetical protein [Streptomyces coffeae]
MTTAAISTTASTVQDGPAAAATHPRHLVGQALRAVRIFATTAFSVAVLGSYADDARGVTIPRH